MNKPAPVISIIVAAAAGGVIGRDGDLPWRLSADLKRFKRLTMGHSILMGRKTFESIGRALPGRTTIVITRQPEFQAEGAIVASSLEEAIEAAPADDEIFVIGGGQIYALALPLARRLYLSEVDAEVDGDTWFPKWNRDDWKMTREQHVAADEKNNFPHTFRVYERTSTSG